MASANPFDLLIDDDSGDTSALLAAVELKLAAANAAENGVATKPPSKPLPPTQPGKESKNDEGRGRGGREDRGYVRGGRGGGGFNRNRETSGSNENGFSLESTVKPYEKRSGFDDGHSRGGRRGGFNNGDADGERPRRNYERRSGSGRGSEIKRDGAGRGNWGTTNDDIAPEVEETVAEIEVNVSDEKPADEEEKVDAEKENKVHESEEKELEEKQMTLDEYQKVLEEKRKALLALREEKGEERKVDVKEFQAMHLVSKKKVDDEVFIKLGSEKDKKRDAAEKEEKAKKSVSINEFLKPADGEGYYRSGGRGRGRGRGRDNRGSGGQYNGGGYPRNNVRAPKIEDEGQFPTLGGK